MREGEPYTNVHDQVKGGRERLEWINSTHTSILRTHAAEQGIFFLVPSRDGRRRKSVLNDDPGAYVTPNWLPAGARG